MGLVVASAALLLAGPPALAASSGDSNRGDIWVDTVGAPSGPGHEMDPHLPCANINLWGSNLGDASGTYAVDSWAPSGSGGAAWSSTWSYSTSSGGAQILDVINVQTLIANAQAAGAVAQSQQGYHFKIQFSQDPQKHKTFWVNCPAATGTGGSGGTSTGGTGSGTGGTSGGQTGGSTGSIGGTTGTTGMGAGSTGGTAGETAAGTPAVAPTATTVGGVQGISTGAAPAAASTGTAGGVLGLSVTTPLTGSRPLLLAWALVLMIAGSVMVVVGRRRAGVRQRP